MKMRNKNGIRIDWIKAAVIGTVCALLMSACLTALLSGLVLRGSVGGAGVSYVIFAIRLLSVVVGGQIGTALSNEKRLYIICAVAVAYLLALLAIGIAFFDGSFNGFGIGLISVVLGGAIVCILRLKPRKIRNHLIRR